MAADVIVEGDYYAMVPEWLLTPEFSSNAVKLYALLRRYADKSTNLAHPSRKTLAARMGFSRPSSVDSAIKELADKGALETFPRFRVDDDGKPTPERTSNGYKLFTKRSTQAALEVGGKNVLPSTPDRTTVVPETAQGVVTHSAPGVVRQTVQQNHSHLEPQSVEPKSVKTKALAKPDAPCDRIAKRSYDATDGALKYVAVRAVAKWATEKKQAEEEAVESAIAHLYRMGKPITNTTVGQMLDGHIRPNSQPQTTTDRMLSTLEMGRRLQNGKAS